MTQRSILVVEDEKPMAKALELKLTNNGFSVTVTHDGEAAVAAFTGGKFDMVLLDLIIPKLDGFHVLESIRKGGSKVPVIVLSNLGQEEDRHRLESLGIETYFVKSNSPIATIVDYVVQFFK